MPHPDSSEDCWQGNISYPQSAASITATGNKAMYKEIFERLLGRATLTSTQRSQDLHLLQKTIKISRNWF